MGAVAEIQTEKTVAVLFGGAGGYGKGIVRSKTEIYGKVFNFRMLCSIDYDPIANHNHDLLLGDTLSVTMDLFDREQYIAFHGQEPPTDWKETTGWDVWQTFGCEIPDLVFLSPPCKGFSGLLPKKSADSMKYQALNRLTLRGLELVLKACVRYGGGLPAFIHFENVPRIQTRGKDLLSKILRLLKRFGFETNMRADHNLGEIGGLGQSRPRFLILARNKNKIPNFTYLPPKKRLRTIGDVIGPLPMPGDIASGGKMNRLPKLTRKSWERLAVIPAGGDWRDLNKADWQNLRLMHEPRGGGAFGVQDWNEPGNAVIGHARINGSNGSAAVADPRINHQPRDGSYEITDWNDPAKTITGNAAIGKSNGVAAVSDPRLGLDGNGMANIYRMQRFEETATCVTGAVGPSNGAPCVSDPRLNKQEGKHPAVYRVVRVDEPAPCVTGTRFGSGAIAIADPSIDTKFNHAFKVSDWNQTGGTVAGGTGPSSGAHVIADPRFDENSSMYNGGYKVTEWDEVGGTVTSRGSPSSGAHVIADPRVKTDLMPDSYGVQDWENTAKTVRGASRIMNSPSSISDPRVNDRLGRYTDQYRMQAFDEAAATVTGVTDIQSGAQLIADPRMNCSPRSGTMGVQDWNEPSVTVIGSMDIHAGEAAVADPRIPEENERCVMIIIAEDGTWHRPLTTYELSQLQGFPTHLPDGRPFQLEQCSDSKAREYIGNAVPPAAAEAMGNVILTAIAMAEAGITFEFGHEEVWVMPKGEQPEITILH